MVLDITPNTKFVYSLRYPTGYLFFRARDGTRTRGLDLGKVALHQLSHSRISYCFVLLLNTRHNIQDNPLSVNHFYAKK